MNREMRGCKVHSMVQVVTMATCWAMVSGCGARATEERTDRADLPVVMDTLPTPPPATLVADSATHGGHTFPNSERPRPEEPGVTVYMTFDDGPHPTTVALAQHLRTLGIRSSFFIVGAQCEHRGLRTVLDSVAAEPLFRLYNHSYSHAIGGGRSSVYYGDPERVWADIERNKAVIGTGGNITRLPGKNTWRTGFRNRTSELAGPFVELLDDRGIDERLVGWDISWGDVTDTGHASVDALVDKTLQVGRHRLRNGHVVVLCHDYQFRRSTSLDQLSRYVSGLRERGNARFAWVEDLPGL
jgi:peptidoglycan/xylan/chitin deacetylase (PgdA/CDA1 family)